MTKLTLILSMIAVSQLALGQSAEDSDIEEIIVIGQLSRSAVRSQIIRVEADVYNFYNANNGNEKLDIICREVTLTGTRIPQRVCEPVFLTEARNREISDFVRDFSGIAELQSPANPRRPWPRPRWERRWPRTWWCWGPRSSADCSRSRCARSSRPSAIAVWRSRPTSRP